MKTGDAWMVSKGAYVGMAYPSSERGQFVNADCNQIVTFVGECNRYLCFYLVGDRLVVSSHCVDNNISWRRL